MIRKLKFIKLPEIEPITGNPITVKLLRRILLHPDLSAQVMHLRSTGNIKLKFNDIHLIFCDTQSSISNDVQKGPFGMCIYIFNSTLKEFIKEQLSNNSDTLLIPRLV